MSRELLSGSHFFVNGAHLVFRDIFKVKVGPMGAWRHVSCLFKEVIAHLFKTKERRQTTCGLFLGRMINPS